MGAAIGNFAMLVGVVRAIGSAVGESVGVEMEAATLAAGALA